MMRTPSIVGVSAVAFAAVAGFFLGDCRQKSVIAEEERKIVSYRRQADSLSGLRSALESDVRRLESRANDTAALVRLREVVAGLESKLRSVQSAPPKFLPTDTVEAVRAFEEFARRY